MKNLDELQYVKNNKITIKGKKGKGTYKNFDLDIYGNHFDGSGLIDFQILRKEKKGSTGEGYLTLIFESPNIECLIDYDLKNEEEK